MKKNILRGLGIAGIAAMTFSLASCDFDDILAQFDKYLNEETESKEAGETSGTAGSSDTVDYLTNLSNTVGFEFTVAVDDLGDINVGSKDGYGWWYNSTDGYAYKKDTAGILLYKYDGSAWAYYETVTEDDSDYKNAVASIGEYTALLKVNEINNEVLGQETIAGMKCNKYGATYSTSIYKSIEFTFCVDVEHNLMLKSTYTYTYNEDYGGMTVVNYHEVKSFVVNPTLPKFTN